MPERATRGYGLLEGFLARRRAAMARKLLGDLRAASVLDVGCGTTPLFLRGLAARERIGIDRVVPGDIATADGIRVLRHDFEAVPALPFEDARFDESRHQDRMAEALGDSISVEYRAIFERGGVRILEHYFALDLWTDGDRRCAGALAVDRHSGETVAFRARMRKLTSLIPR